MENQPEEKKEFNNVEYQKKYLELDINCEVENQNRVAAVICTKDKSHLLYQLVSSLQKNMEVDEIVIVSNNPSNVYTKKIKELILNFNKVKIIDYPGSFNFSEQCNLGASQTVLDMSFAAN